jgi:hypothetical protein
MKKIVAIILSITFLVNTAFAPVPFSNEERVLQVFNESFKNVQDLKWFNSGDSFTAYFTTNNIRTKITYDGSGRFQSSRRVVPLEYLPLNVVSEVKTKFCGKDIKEIVEFVEDNQVSYSIRIEDEINCWLIEALTNGDEKEIARFKKVSVR